MYQRGSLLLAVNPDGISRSVEMKSYGRQLLFSIGEGSLENGKLTAGPQSFLVFK